MNSVTGIIAFGNGRTVPIEETSLKDIDLNIGDEEWDVGIDQSTSLTGIALVRTDLSIIVMLDIKRDKTLEKRAFFMELKMFLMRTLKNRNVRFLIHERPVPKKQFATAQKELYELKGRLEEWLYEIPGLENTKLDSLFPNTWKSQVMDKSKGTNRSKVKSEIARDLVDIYPVLKEFYYSYPYSSYDSFDALGIITGFKKVAFNSAGFPQIYGTEEKRHTALAFFLNVPKTLKFNEVIDAMLHDSKEITNFQGIEFLAYNFSYDLTKNIRVASSGRKNPVMTLIPESEYQFLKWSFEMEPKPDENVFCLIFSKSAITGNDYSLLQSLMPANKEIFGE